MLAPWLQHVQRAHSSAEKSATRWSSSIQTARVSSLRSSARVDGKLAYRTLTPASSFPPDIETRQPIHLPDHVLAPASSLLLLLLL
jgi:hypothetical protein